ncbi:trypsin-like peptidase domain-containing protein [Haloferula sp. BvORR071]|uniref:S1C family serine protease n=1 Tax=Haloferula sp. BvORR071 TaxID=1396141 RepID=UPI00055304D0|nr:trypsin-like peptidase domain-containing protein [Haloferula sp. BvORR071]
MLARLIATLTLAAPASLLAQAEAPPIPKTPAGAPSDIYRSAVRIEAAVQVPDYTTPWNSGRFGGGIGTGFLIGENQFLTNAHVISNERRLLITIHGSSKKYPARVKFVAHDCDLALLEVEDFSDFKKVPKLSFGDVPQLESQVRVIGYPIGGERLSVTRGVVSRIDFSSYSHSRADQHLIVQIDAAINPGNSGGPVVQDGKVVGVAFQGLRQADNTGYIIPTPVIRRFLKDIEDGSYDQYVDLGAATFPLFNPAMRKSLKMEDNGLGVLVTDVTKTGACDGTLEPGDVLLSIDGHDVDSGGQILLDGEKVDLNEVVERKFAGDTVALKWQRAGNVIAKEIALKTLPPSRMYAIQYEKKPRYTVFAGLVFQPLDTNLFAASKFDDVNVRRLYSDYVPKGLFTERQDIVVLTRIESDPLNSQLGGFDGLAVDKINGTMVKSLKQAHELLNPETAPDYFVIELFGANRPIVIPGKDVAAANERVRRTYSIERLSNLTE